MIRLSDGRGAANFESKKGEKGQKWMKLCEKYLMSMGAGRHAITANNLYFDTQELPHCPLTKQTVYGRIVWR